MKILIHPLYPAIPIYVAQSVADKPKAGAFFVTYQGIVLSTIASRAYGSGNLTSVKRINQSAYNRAHCFYRESSSNCNSSRVDPNLAMASGGWDEGLAWISLCPADKAGADGIGASLGVNYQVIWVPPLTGGEPQDGGTSPFHVVIPEPDPQPDPPHVDPFPTPDPDPAPGPDPGPDDGGNPEPELKKAGVPWWLGAILGLGAISTVIYFAVRDKKKLGKKSKKR
jgi:hypothetical protein